VLDALCLEALCLDALRASLCLDALRASLCLEALCLDALMRLMLYASCLASSVSGVSYVSPTT
jgi:hypothetical protein